MMHGDRVFPRHLPLPSPNDADVPKHLHASKVKANQIKDPEYWHQLCPDLHVTDSRTRNINTKPIKLEGVDAICKEVQVEGVAVVHADQLPWQGLDFTVLARSVVRLMQAGWPASFIIMYDEVWQLVEQLSGVMQDATGNAINMDILAWYVDPNQGHAGFSPHRDRQPEDISTTFRPDGTAKYTTAWIPFVDACPENSCLYVIPRWADPGYTAGDDQEGPDPLQVALASKESYQHMRALPAEAGSAVIFTHRILHWGSRGRLGYHTPRISLSFGCADDSYEPAYFDRTKHLPHPPVALRAALICAQMIAYHERFDLTPKLLTMFKSVFTSQASEFHPTYRAKVLEEFVAATKFVRGQATQQQSHQSVRPAAMLVDGPSKQQQTVDNTANAKQVPQTTQQPAHVEVGRKPKAEVKPKADKKSKSDKQPDGSSVIQKGSELTDTAFHEHAEKPKKLKDSKRQKRQQDEDLIEELQASKEPTREMQAGKASKEKKKKKKAKVDSMSNREEQEVDDSEDEGPGFDVLLQQQALAEGSHEDEDDDVDLLDEALDAALEARMEGFDAGFEDDFGSDMEASFSLDGADDLPVNDDDEDGHDSGALMKKPTANVKQAAKHLSQKASDKMKKPKKKLVDKSAKKPKPNSQITGKRRNKEADGQTGKPLKKKAKV